MYRGVPSGPTVKVASDSEAGNGTAKATGAVADVAFRAARPKSSTQACPSVSTMMFDGFKSR